MLRLPEVMEDASPWRPQLSDALATRLFAILLIPAVSQRGDQFQQLLAAESVFKHWAHLRRHEMEVGTGTPTAQIEVGELAQWLAKHFIEALRETEPTDPLPPECVDQQGMLVALLKRLSRLRDLEESFEETLQKEKLSSLRELAYGASHEINNPLANIATRAQTMIAEETDPEKKRKLAVITSQAYRAHEMISDMMLFAKPPAAVKKALVLIPLVRQVVQELKVLGEQQGTSVELVGEAAEISLQADANQVAFAIKALGHNALESLRTGGKVEITVRSVVGSTEKVLAGPHWNLRLRSDGCKERVGVVPQVEIVVRDNGPGVSLAAREHLFDPFYSGREAGRGLGFGLSKCWRIAEMHAGEVEVESETGAGACFTLRLPRE